jgi:hypothetical protein
VRNLDSSQFPTCQKAMKELEQMGEGAESAIRRLLAGSPSVEVRRRADQLLRLLDKEFNPLRRSRCLEVLEHAGTPEARRLLAALARGAPHAALTTEARAALDRLGQ